MNMAIRAVKLADLIEQGRSVPFADGAAPVVQPVALLEKSTVAPPADARASTAISSGIELLAIQLLSLSKVGNDDPRALMIEALRSIDRCLVSLAGQR
jgi:hypothetical protein